MYDEFERSEEWEEEERIREAYQAQAGLSILRFFFQFEQEPLVLPAAPPENEEEEWDGLNLTAKVWYELGE